MRLREHWKCVRVNGQNKEEEAEEEGLQTVVAYCDEGSQ